MATLNGDVIPRLVRKSADLMSAIGLSVVPDSTNADAMDAIGWACNYLKIVPAAGFVPADPDLQSLTVSAYWTMIDLATYAILETCRNRWTQVTVRVGSGELRESDLRDSLDRRIEILEKRYGLNAGRLIGGSITRQAVDAVADDPENGYADGDYGDFGP